MNANTFIKKLKFINGVVPEEHLEGLRVFVMRKLHLGHDFREREEGVIADLFCKSVGQVSCGVEIICEHILGFFDCFGPESGPNFQEIWEIFDGGGGGGGEVAV